ncbi:MAG: YggS family pyridoxal phosphate-dependent enzyme [Chitinophagaceae bacterium]|nr:YggS family pyridoxal phosphate-dependent enzyme [Chitinophagaceae bacterium]
MAANKETYDRILNELGANVELVAVSKIQPVKSILALYNFGHRDFGENYVQELVDKSESLSKDIRWHFIGHLQTNKVKYIAPFVHLIQGVDSFKLLKEINKQAEKNNRVINVLLQLHIATEATKFGLDKEELQLLIDQIQTAGFNNIRVMGLMGMATFTDDLEIVKNEFTMLKSIFDIYVKIDHPLFNWKTLSMGMSDDYKIALSTGSNMVRIGSLLFGRRIMT